MLTAGSDTNMLLQRDHREEEEEEEDTNCQVDQLDGDILTLHRSMYKNDGPCGLNHGS